MIKRCIDCGCPFECYNKKIRCDKCQDKYRSEYQSRYWSDKPIAAHSGKYYQFWKLVQTLTDDEIRALIQVKKQRMNEVDADIKQLRTHIKIMTEEYKKRQGDKIERNQENE